MFTRLVFYIFTRLHLVSPPVSPPVNEKIKNTEIRVVPYTYIVFYCTYICPLYHIHVGHSWLDDRPYSDHKTPCLGHYGMPHYHWTMTQYCANYAYITLCIIQYINIVFYHTYIYLIYRIHADHSQLDGEQYSYCRMSYPGHYDTLYHRWTTILYCVNCTYFVHLLSNFLKTLLKHEQYDAVVSVHIPLVAIIVVNPFITYGSIISLSTLL